jgi:eukaryotic-like serine/threonine-protein kinase
MWDKDAERRSSALPAAAKEGGGGAKPATLGPRSRSQGPPGAAGGSGAGGSGPDSVFQDSHFALHAPALIGPYALKRLLGHGRLGHVYAAYDGHHKREVAINWLPLEPDSANRDALATLFTDAMRQAASLQHPHIVQLHDTGAVREGVFLASEWLSGRSLSEAWQQQWQASPAQAADLTCRVAQAVAYAHGRGVVHGAIGPQCVFVTESGAPKLMGFGWARVASESSLPELDPLVAGAAHYLAPEQLRGGTVDERTDVHALGALLFELLAGRPAFAGHTVPQVVQALMKHAPLAPHLGKPEVPQAVSEIAMRALRREPADRYASVAEMVKALQDWLHSADSAAAGGGNRTGAGWGWQRWAVAAGLLVTGSVVALAIAARSNGQQPHRQNQPQNHPQTQPQTQTQTQPEPQAGPQATVPAVVAPVGAVPAVVQPLTAASAPMLPPVATGPSPSVQVEQPAAAPATPAPERASGQAPAATPALQVAQAPAAPTKAAADAKRRAPPSAAPPAARNAPAVAPATTAGATPPAKGLVRLAISPWGEVEVNGKAVGISPPLTQLSLTEGNHTITVRNGDAPPHTSTVQVSADQAATVRHRFGP